MREALLFVRAAPTLDLETLRAAQSVVLGRAATLRQVPAFTKGGRERYGVIPRMRIPREAPRSRHRRALPRVDPRGGSAKGSAHARAPLGGSRDGDARGSASRQAGDPRDRVRPHARARLLPERQRRMARRVAARVHSLIERPVESTPQGGALRRRLPDARRPSSTSCPSDRDAPKRGDQAEFR